MGCSSWGGCAVKDDGVANVGATATGPALDDLGDAAAFH